MGRAEDDDNGNGVQPFVSWPDIRQKGADSVAFDATIDPAPYQVSAWGPGQSRYAYSSSSFASAHFGFVLAGPTKLVRHVRNARGETQKLEFTLADEMYFSCPPGEFEIEGGSGLMIRVPCGEGSNKNNNNNAGRWSSMRPLFAVGGPLEDYGEGEGRLPYIDGGSDTLLLAPVLWGAPCLNYMHFPSNTQQTQHTHPSGRIGIVVRGKAQCIVETTKPTTTSSADPAAESTTITKSTPLEAGTVFVIPKDSPHAFATDTDPLDVVVFHPDSDFGPTPSDHPMLNRTYVQGISATKLSAIQTK